MDQINAPYSRIERREPVLAVGREWQGVDADYGGQIKLVIQMRKQRAAARAFPPQFAGQPACIDTQQHEIVLAGEMPGRRFGHLFGAGEMNETVTQVIRGAAEDAGAFGFAPERGRADFVERGQLREPVM